MISNYATNIALISKSTQKITNIIWGNIYNVDEWITDEQNAIVVNDLAVRVGDDYNPETEKFYRNGEQVKSISEEMEEKNNEIDELMGMLYEADGGTPVNEEA